MSSNREFQTTFGFGHDHYSSTHADHTYGSTAPVQRDFGLNLPQDRFRPLVGMDSPSGLHVQSRLTDFLKR